MDAHDVELILMGLQGVFENAAVEGLGLAPCQPTGLINLADLQQGLKARGGESFGAGVCSIRRE